MLPNYSGKLQHYFLKHQPTKHLQRVNQTIHSQATNHGTKTINLLDCT